MTSDEEPRQEHSRDGDKWERHTEGPKRDRAADKAVRDALLAELAGDYLPDGSYQPSTWGPA